MLVVSVSFPFRSSRLLTRHSDRLFETAHTLCFWIYLYRVMVLNYGDLSILTKRDWSLSLSVAFHGIISALVQVSKSFDLSNRPISLFQKAYYAYRIWVLSRWHYISIISWGGSVLEILGSIGVTTALQKLGPIELTAHWKWIAITTIALDVFIDTVNTAALSFFLYTHRTGFKQCVTTFDLPHSNLHLTSPQNRPAHCEAHRVDHR